MDRVKFSYLKAWLMVVMAAAAVVLVFVGGGPQNYSPIMLAIPVLLVLFSGYFFWEAQVFRKRRDGNREDG